MLTERRLIGIDIDGTLLRGSDEPQPDDLAAIQEAATRGVPVVLATGRSHFSSQPVADAIAANTTHVTYNGAWIVGPGGRLMRDLRVPLDITRDVLRRCRDLGLAVRVFTPDCVIMSEEPAPDEQFFKYRSFEKVDTSIADTIDVEPMQMVIVHRDDVSAFATEFVGTPVEHDLHWMLTGRDPEAPYHWALHLLNKEGTKSSALGQLCREWDIDPANTLAFGDGPNDVDMLRWAGIGVSFPWGIPEAQAAADIISDPVDPHPLATMIYPWLDGKPLLQHRVA